MGTPKQATSPPWPAVTAVSAVSGLMVVAITLSFATLIYSGVAALHLATGAGLMLIGAAAINLITARWMSLKGSVLVPQDVTTAVVAVSLASILPGVSQASVLGTVIAFGLLATALTGLVMLVLGSLRLGNLVRFIPFPVIGGFMAGTGWLLISGGAELVTAGFQWTTPRVISLAAAGIFAVGVVVWLRFRPSAMTVPIAVLAGLVVFYVAIWLAGLTVAEARSLGLLPDLAPVAFSLPLSALTAVDWSAIWTGAGGLLAVPLVATLALLLNVTGLELVADSDADLNRDLRGVGSANLAASLTGMPAGYHTIGVTALGFRAGISSRWVPVVVGGACLLALVGGSTLVSLLPTPLVAALLMLIGVSFLVDWLVDGRHQITGPEYFTMVAIMVAVPTLGFVAAILLGLTAAVLLFAMAYSRIDPIRFVASGRQRRSVVEWNAKERRVLEERMDTIRLIELQGYLFFGTARAVLDNIKGLIDDGLKALVLDMKRVQGLDSTGLASFQKLHRLADKGDLLVVISDAASGLEAILKRAGCVEGVTWKYRPDVDDALEEAEAFVLGQEFEDEFDPEAIFGPGLWERLKSHMRTIEVDTDETVVEFGEPADELFLVAEGWIAADIPTEDGRWRRVGSSGPGTIFGEVSVYRGGGRTARLRAEEPSKLYALSAEAIGVMEREDPNAAAEFHRVLAGVLADRLSRTNETIRALLT